jgi:hypothetical protein
MQDGGFARIAGSASAGEKPVRLERIEQLTHIRFVEDGVGTQSAALLRDSRRFRHVAAQPAATPWTDLRPSRHGSQDCDHSIASQVTGRGSACRFV